MECSNRPFKRMASFLLVFVMLLTFPVAFSAEEAQPEALAITGAQLVNEGFAIDAVVDSDADAITAEVVDASQQLVLAGRFGEAAVTAEGGEPQAYDQASGMALALTAGENRYTIAITDGETERVYSLAINCTAAPAEEAELGAEADPTTATNLMLAKNLFSWNGSNSINKDEVHGLEVTLVGDFIKTKENRVQTTKATYTATISTSYSRPHLVYHSYGGHSYATLTDIDNDPIDWRRTVPVNANNPENAYDVVISAPLYLEEGANTYTLAYERSRAVNNETIYPGISTVTDIITYNITINADAESDEPPALYDIMFAQTPIFMSPSSAPKRLELMPIPADASIDPEEICWYSEDEEIATVENGYVTAVEVGTTYIWAEYSDGYSARCEVHVLEDSDLGAPPDFTEISEKYTHVRVGAQTRLHVQWGPLGTMDPNDLTVYSEDPSVASIHSVQPYTSTYYWSYGAYIFINGEMPGRTKVVASGKDFTLTCEVIVPEVTGTIRLGNTSHYTLTAGEEMELYAYRDPADMIVDWSVSEGADLIELESIASIYEPSKDHLITSTGKTGTATIRVQSRGNPNIWDECNISIVPAIPPGTENEQLAAARLDVSSVKVNVTGDAKETLPVWRSTVNLQYAFNAPGNSFYFDPVAETDASEAAAKAMTENFTVEGTANDSALLISYKGKQSAADIKKLSSSYKGKLMMRLKTSETTSNEVELGVLTIKVNKKDPVLKATALNFNTFTPAGLVQRLNITGGTLTGLRPNSKKNGTGTSSIGRFFWVSGAGDVYNLATRGSVVKKGTYHMLATVEGYGDKTFPVSVKVNAKPTQPALALSSSRLSLPKNMSTYAPNGMGMTLKLKKGSQSLDDLNVVGISVVPKGSLRGKDKTTYKIQDELYYVKDDKVDLTTGAFTLATDEGKDAKSTKLLLQVHFSNTGTTLRLPVTITAASSPKLTLKPSVKTVTLNKAQTDGDPVTIKVTPSHTFTENPVYKNLAVTCKGKAERLDGPLKIEPNGWDLKIATTNDAKAGSSYKVTATAEDPGNSNKTFSFSVTVKVIENDASAVFTGKVKGSVDLTAKTGATLNLTLTGHQAGIKSIRSFKVTDATKARNPVDVTGKLELTLNSEGGLTCTIAPSAGLYNSTSTDLAPNTYYLSEIEATDGYGQSATLKTPVKFKIVASKSKVSVSSTNVSLYRQDNTKAAASVKLASQAAAPIESVAIRGSLANSLTANYQNGTVTFGFAEETETKKIADMKAKTYNVVLEITYYGNAKYTDTVKMKIAVK